MHLAIEALALIDDESITLDVYGEGPEKARLLEQARELGVDGRVRFAGTVPYGKPFYEAIAQYDIMLLTNLNREQPRLVFDAIACGVILLCPNNESYQPLNLHQTMLFDTGNARAIANAIAACQEAGTRWAVFQQIAHLAHDHTVDAMHSRRLHWLSESGLIESNDSGHP